MTYQSSVPNQPGGTSWPIHEIGRNADQFPQAAGRLLAANSVLDLSASHIHANGHDTKAHLEFGFKFFPKGYQPQYKPSPVRLGNGNDLDVKPNQADQEIHAYATLTEHTKIVAFEPHLHAPGVRMCLEAIWGMNVQQLNCVGYDHNWVKQYIYEDDAAPLLPKGTILHLIGFLDTTPNNKNLADVRNWAGGGRRSVSNMFIDLGYSVTLTEEQFQAEMAGRRAKMKNRNVYDIGCPVCWAPPVGRSSRANPQRQEKPVRDPSRMLGRRDWCRARLSRSCTLRRLGRRSDRFSLLVRTGARAGVRGLVAEPRRIVHAVLRLHEHQLAPGVRHPRGTEQPLRARQSGRRAADALLSASQSVPVHHPGAEGLRHQRNHLDADGGRPHKSMRIKRTIYDPQVSRRKSAATTVASPMHSGPTSRRTSWSKARRPARSRSGNPSRSR
jgi:hypothetical protein